VHSGGRRSRTASRLRGVGFTWALVTTIRRRMKHDYARLIGCAGNLCVRRGGDWKGGMVEIRDNGEHKLRTPARQSSTLPMSEDGKRGVADWPKLPRLSSTLPEQTSEAVLPLSRLGRAILFRPFRHPPGRLLHFPGHDLRDLDRPIATYPFACRSARARLPFDEFQPCPVA